jgi:hypothetical protein
MLTLESFQLIQKNIDETSIKIDKQLTKLGELKIEYNKLCFELSVKLALKCVELKESYNIYVEGSTIQFRIDEIVLFNNNFFKCFDNKLVNLFKKIDIKEVFEIFKRELSK